MIRNPLIAAVATGFLIAATVLAHAEGAATKPSDEQIAQQVKSKLAADDPIVAPRILVTVHDGVVRLEGIALTQQYILKAVHDAGSIGGVVRVENRLTLE